MDLILTRGDKGRVQVEKRDGERLCGRVESRFSDNKMFAEASDELDVPRPKLMEVVDAFQKSEEASRTVPLAAPPPSAFVVAVRGRYQPGSAGQSFGESEPLLALRRALDAICTAPEPLIVWEGKDRLAAADVDFHAMPYESRHPQGYLYQLIERVQPRPSLAWSTHGRGLRLIYTAAGGYTAEELAAASALSISSIDPLATVEIKADSRHPKYALGNGRTCGPIRELTQTADVSALAAWLGRKEVSEDQIEEWLTERGLEIGRRYEHACCPVRPQEPGNREPVTVRENGVFCHVCNGRGVTYGHRVPGWFPFAALTGATIPTQLRLCLENMTHWEHAKFVLTEAVSMGEDVARAAYSAALRMLHGDDPRLPRVFHAGRDLIRFERKWVTNAGETYTKDVGPIVRTLPVCLFINSKGKLQADEEIEARFAQPIDLTGYGYPALTPVWGVRIYGHRLTVRDPNRIPVVVQQKALAPECMEAFRPRYVPVDQRELDEAAAWETLEEVFPKLHREAVKLLVAAKGVAEGEVGLPPMMFFSGPTGAAKTGTITVAAAICGDTNHSVPWANNVERLRQAILEGKDQGSFITFNEIVKDSKEGGKSLAKSLDFLLNITPDSMSHKLYVGPVQLGALPVCCLTDTMLPIEIKQHAQLARRLVHIHLPQRVKWEESIRASGLNKIEHLRIADPRYSAACNVILSAVMDSYFTAPMTFEEIAADLGFGKLEQSAEAVEKQDTLRQFFAWICSAEESAGTDSKRWKGRGWKVIDRQHKTELAELWGLICDECFISSEKCNETDWAALIGVDGPVICEIRSHGTSRVAVRFIRRRNRKDYDVNGEINGSVELATGPGTDGDDRPGNPERCEP